jgi:RimJ/RimL family protein N-acetyltransferase
VRSWLPHRGELRDAWVGTLLPDDPREPQGRWLDLPELEGEGVRLRAMTPADTARVVEACRDERTRHWLGDLPSPYDEEAAAKFIAGRTLPLATGKGLSWAVVDPVTDLLLGSIGLLDLTEDLACGEIGYWTHPQARGRGVMTEAVALVLGHAFGGLGLRRVKAYAATGNAASERVLTANGLIERGVERLGALLETGRADSVLFDVLAEEWPARR